MEAGDFVRHYKYKKHWGVIIECCLVDRGSVKGTINTRSIGVSSLNVALLTGEV
jgi:hypothetical protein